jgi:hypothetical protein
MLDQLHNRVDRGRWLVELDVVSAPFGNQLLAVG